MPVYFIQQGNDGPIKIGYTGGDVQKRISQLKTGSPKPLHLLGMIDTKKKNEEFIHLLFKDHRLKGEWFKPDKSILEFIEKYNFYQYTQSPARAGNGNQMGFDDLLLVYAAPAVEKLEERLEETFEEKKEQPKKEKFYCVVCGKQMKAGKYSHAKKYCSQECRFEAKAKTFTCKGCGKRFRSLSPKKYCSNECRTYGDPKHKKACVVCGDLYNRYNPGHIYCSRICSYVALIIRETKGEMTVQQIKERLIEVLTRL